MFADAKRVATRRWKRRAKAAASIVVALAAGTFLACQRGAEVLRGAVTPAADAAGAREPDADEGIDAAGDAMADGGLEAGGDAGDSREAGRGPRSTDAAVDVDEHRKGMPVRDNLLE